MRSLYSLISTGTELMKVGESKLSLVGKARARPDQVKKVLENVQQQGALTTYKKAMNRLDSYSPLGYSLAGVVAGGRAREPRSSRSANSLRAPGMSLPSTPSSTGYRPISASRCPTACRHSWPPSPPSVRSRCRVFVRAMSRLGTRRASSAWVSSGSWSSSCSWPPESKWSASTPTRTDAGWPRRRVPCCARRRTTRVLLRWSRPCRRPRAGSVPTGSFSWPAALRTSRSNWPLAWRATGRRSSTSASASSICPGTTTTRRNSSFGSPARTGRAAMTPDTNSTESTTRRATCAGRSGAISTAS